MLIILICNSRALFNLALFSFISFVITNVVFFEIDVVTLPPAASIIFSKSLLRTPVKTTV